MRPITRQITARCRLGRHRGFGKGMNFIPSKRIPTCSCGNCRFNLSHSVASKILSINTATSSWTQFDYKLTSEKKAQVPGVILRFSLMGPRKGHLPHLEALAKLKVNPIGVAE